MRASVSGLRLGCIMTLRLFQRVYGYRENMDGEEARERRLPGLLNADDLVLCRRRGLKINANKSKVMVLSGEEGSLCEILVDGM